MEEKDNIKRKNEKNEADTTDGNSVLVEQALKSFCCYLYVGKGRPYYKAKPWNDDESYPIKERLQCLDILASNKKTELVPIDKIKLAMDSKLIQRPETLMFALAMCARQRKSEKLRTAAYYFLAEHCKEWKYFILFIKYASMLCKMRVITDDDGTDGHNGYGHGWKNAVNKWYLTQTPTALVNLVTHHKGDHGWKHKDILKLSHPNTHGLEVEKQAIICYIFRGIDEARNTYGSHPEAKKMLDHIAFVELFKKCDEPAIVAQLIKEKKFTIDQVHPRALKYKEVWLSLLEGMDVRMILKNVPKLMKLGLLTEEGPATDLVVRSLADESSLRWNKVLPSDVIPILKELCALNEISLEDLSTRLKRTQKTRRWVVAGAASVGNANGSQKNAKLKARGRTTKATQPRMINENDVIIYNALRTTLDIAQTVDITDSNTRTYLVSVTIPGNRMKMGCIRAGLAIAFPLLNRENLPKRSVTIVALKPRLGQGIAVPITKDMSIGEATEHLMDSKCECEMVPMCVSPIDWAFHEGRKKYDVFINVTNEPPKKHLLDLMAAYRKLSNSPESRLINVVINEAPFELKGDHWNDTLVINGFDPHVPWIIEAYARGLF